VKAYQQAIALDSNYAVAYAGLAMAEAYLADATGDAAGRQRAEVAADHAVTLAPDLIEVYVVRGTLRLVFSWDWRGAQEDLSLALVLDPRDSLAQRQYGRLCRSVGRMREAIAAGEKAATLDPLSNFVWEGLGNTYAAAGEFAAAGEAYRKALELQSDSFYATDGLGVVELLSGRPAEALRLFNRIQVEHAFRLPGMAMAEYALGHSSNSRRALDDAIAQQSSTGAYDIAAAFAWTGESGKALYWLERAYEQREQCLSEVKIDPLLSSVRNEPRYLAMLRKMHLAD
jgi:tetratricopeptide (TPR) repeat protein